MSGEAALRVVAKIVATPQPTEKANQAMLTDLAPDLSVEEQHLLTIVSMKQQSVQSYNMSLLGGLRLPLITRFVLIK